MRVSARQSAARARALLCCYPALLRETNIIVAIVTFHLAQPTPLAEITKTFQSTAPRYQGMTGLLRKNYWLSEDGRRAGGIYVWASRADAERVYTAEWKKLVESKYGSPPSIGRSHIWAEPPRCETKAINLPSWLHRGWLLVPAAVVTCLC